MTDDTAKQRVLDLIARDIDEPHDDDAFNAAALLVFAYQFEHNLPYRGYCQRRGITPGFVERWEQVPAVPTAAFKEVALVAGAVSAAEASFRTSGTTRGVEKRGVHHILDLSLYHASLLPNFAACVLPDGAVMRMLSLIPPAEDAPDSSLSHMTSVVMRELGAPGSAFCADGTNGVDFAALDAAVEAAVNDRAPLCLLGTSFAFVHWLDHLHARGHAFALPDGSRIMDTGGYKGRSRDVPEGELRALYEEALRVPASHVVNEYGMTEMCSQFYDATLRDRVRAGSGVPRKLVPPWVRTRIVEPETLRPVEDGTVGILQHHDLANLYSVAAVQTEDMAVAVDGGFRLLGRAPGATPRGCSIAMDLLLQSAAERRRP